MYTFRYHLVTICSIFVALALGLLLGAAIASSELAQTTSDDMVETMLSRYEELSETNERLENDLSEYRSLSSVFIDPWAEERLDGRVIVLFFGNNTQDTDLKTNLTTIINHAGGSVVNVSFQKTGFDLDNEETRTALQTIVEEVGGEDYSQTLSKKLVEEWSYVYATSSTTSTDADLEVAYHEYTQDSDEQAAEVEEPASEEEGQEEPVIESSPLDGGLVPQTDFQKILFNQYSLTRALLTLGIISIDVDYAPLTQHEEPAATTDQQAALAVATAWQLPYCVNGCIVGYVSESVDSTELDQAGVQLALNMQQAATDGKLMYPAWLRASLPKTTSGDVALPNYHVLLVQPSNTNISVDTIASTNNLSCVTSPQSVSGQYSVIALLSGAQAGTYGEDRSSENRYAPLPEDTSGRAAFR